VSSLPTSGPRHIYATPQAREGTAGASSLVDCLFPDNTRYRCRADVVSRTQLSDRLPWSSKWKGAINMRASMRTHFEGARFTEAPSPDDKASRRGTV